MEQTPVVFPYIPQRITVHLGSPKQEAENLTVPFSQYIKNVASSEIYPTWGPSALRANILAIISFALNRIYTEHYPSQGYPFDITNSTAFDQAYTKGRSYFENISMLVDELFTSYIRRIGFVEPLAAKFCNGTTSKCTGLSQWGSEELSKQGYNSIEILKYYYGEDIEIVVDAPIRGNTPSYPGTPLKLGSVGPYVTVIQVSLNRIRKNYPAIPKISRVNGIYGEETEQAVREFQTIFLLQPDGIVGPSTWYKIVRLYVAVLKLAELQSEGQTEYRVAAGPKQLDLGETGPAVRQLQYMLAVASAFIEDVPPLEQTGVYDQQTKRSMQEFQRYAGLPVTGEADLQTWNLLDDQVRDVDDVVFRQNEQQPEESSG